VLDFLQRTHADREEAAELRSGRTAEAAVATSEHSSPARFG